MKNLTTLIAVAQTGSFTAAGRQLGLTTSAVSKLVARYERDLDARLFNRTTRQLSLTNQGRVFLEKAQHALNELASAVDQLHEARQEAAGLIRIVSNVAIGKEYILPLLADFMAKHPKVSVEIKFDDGIADLVREGYDIGIQHIEISEQSYISRPLGQFPLILVASPGYLARKGIPRTPAELESHDAISVRQNSGQNAAWEFSRIPEGVRKPRSAQPKPYLHVPAARLLVAEQYDAVINGALLGMGITVVFAQTVLPHLRRGELKVLLPDFDVSGVGIENNRLFLRYPHREYQPFSVRQLVDCLVEHFRNKDTLKFDRHAWAA